MIRRATPDDAATLCALAERTFVETFGHLYPPQDLADYLAGAYPVDLQRQQLAHFGAGLVGGLAGVEDALERSIEVVGGRLGAPDVQLCACDAADLAAGQYQEQHCQSQRYPGEVLIQAGELQLFSTGWRTIPGACRNRSGHGLRDSGLGQGDLPGAPQKIPPLIGGRQFRPPAACLQMPFLPRPCFKALDKLQQFDAFRAGRAYVRGFGYETFAPALF